MLLYPLLFSLRQQWLRVDKKKKGGPALDQVARGGDVQARNLAGPLLLGGSVTELNPGRGESRINNITGPRDIGWTGPSSCYKGLPIYDTSINTLHGALKETYQKAV